jgi:hypothetical protein
VGARSRLDWNFETEPLDSPQMGVLRLLPHRNRASRVLIFYQPAVRIVLACGS